MDFVKFFHSFLLVHCCCCVGWLLCGGFCCCNQCGCHWLHLQSSKCCEEWIKLMTQSMKKFIASSLKQMEKQWLHKANVLQHVSHHGTLWMGANPIHSHLWKGPVTFRRFLGPDHCFIAHNGAIDSVMSNAHHTITWERDLTVTFCNFLSQQVRDVHFDGAFWWCTFNFLDAKVGQMCIFCDCFFIQRLFVQIKEVQVQNRVHQALPHTFETHTVVSSCQRSKKKEVHSWTNFLMEQGHGPQTFFMTLSCAKHH